MDNRINYKTVLISGIVLATIIFVVSLNAGQVYKGQAEILLLPKCEKTQSDLEHILGNVETVPLTLSFYDKLLENNSDIEDEAQGLPEDQRKELWNKKISLNQIGKSSVILVEVFDPNQFQSEIITTQLVKDTILVFSRYYNIKDELEIRIVDETVTSRVYHGNIFFLIIIATIVGLLTAFIIWGIIAWVRQMLSQRKSQDNLLRKGKEQIMKSGKEITSFSQRLARSLREENEKQEKISMPIPEEPAYEFPIKKKEQEKTFPEIKATEIEIPNEPVNFPEIPATQSFSKKSSAPGNLPIADESVMKLFPKKKKEPSKPQEKKEEKNGGLYREATPEEVRERLNKLLKGKF